MNKFKDSYDALDSLVNCYADYYDRKEAEELIKQDLDKLGKIKNLKEELGINIIDLLEDFKKEYESKKDVLKKHPEITLDYMCYVVGNGISYRKLSEELGCPLEVLIKPLLKGGIIDNDGYGVQLTGLAINGDGSLSLTAVNGDHYDLKDYKKTWWLKGEKNETL